MPKFFSKTLRSRRCRRGFLLFNLFHRSFVLFLNQSRVLLHVLSSICSVADLVLLGGVLTDDFGVQEHGLLADTTRVIHKGDDLLLEVPEGGDVGGLGHLVPVGDVFPQAGHLVHAVAEIAEDLDVEAGVIALRTGALHFVSVFWNALGLEVDWLGSFEGHFAGS